MGHHKTDNTLGAYQLEYENLVWHFNSSNTTKYLTNSIRSGILKLVNKLKKKGRQMAQDKTKTKRGNATKKIISLAWLVFAVQQTFNGYVLLTNFDNYFVVASALVSLGFAGVIVTAHFFIAHN